MSSIRRAAPGFDPARDDSFVLPTRQQAEDAGANALAALLRRGIERHLREPGATFDDALREAARDVLRGSLDEAIRGQRGGYCMRAPTDPVLYAIGRLGAALVELSYTVRNPARAVAEAARLFGEYSRRSVAINIAINAASTAAKAGSTPTDAPDRPLDQPARSGSDRTDTAVLAGNRPAEPVSGPAGTAALAGNRPSKPESRSRRAADAVLSITNVAEPVPSREARPGSRR